MPGFFKKLKLKKTVRDVEAFVKDSILNGRESSIRYSRIAEVDRNDIDSRDKRSTDIPKKEETVTENRGTRSSGTIRFSKRIPEDDPREAVSTRDRFNIQTVTNSLGRIDLINSARKIDLNELGIVKDLSFADRLMEYINEKGLKETDVYRAANIDRRLFSKIISGDDYRPSKDTCVALLLALKLTFVQADDMLQRAGHAFSHSNERDIALEYFFRKGIYRVDDVNWILSRMNLRPLGRQDAV